VFDTLAKTGNTADFQHWFEVMKMAGVNADVDSFNTAISGCFTPKIDMDGALKWLRLMINRRVKPNMQTFSILIDASVKVSDFEKAREWLRLMRDSGLVRLTKDSFIPAINALGVNENMPESWCEEVVDVMLAGLGQQFESLHKILSVPSTAALLPRNVHKILIAKISQYTDKK
jgi:pentatricopeptide repeat protein